MWNAYYYSDPFEFANANYFSADSQALEGSNRADLYLQPLNVISLYFVTALVMYGPALLTATLIGFVIQKHFDKNGQSWTYTRNLCLFLILPPIFTIASLIFGIGEMNQRDWFNSRFLVTLAPTLILLTSIFIKRLLIHTMSYGNNKTRRNNLAPIGSAATIIGVLFLYQILIVPTLGIIIILLDAQHQFHFSVPDRSSQINAAEALNSIYDGKSTNLDDNWFFAAQ